ncbi:hypothetical protein [Caulobacter sp. DWP3-1-3b2]|uniref:hypothetical protein n=1 Tax=Caulobacter sp. DWP3-1-3b2 TaxID=2804643 RepID=UPI003CF17933
MWIENSGPVEVLPPACAAEYLGFAEAVALTADPDTPPDAHQPQIKTLEHA